MFEDYFKTSEEAGSLYRVEDLLGVVNDAVQDLRRFVNKWDPTLASQFRRSSSGRMLKRKCRAIGSLFAKKQIADAGVQSF